MQADVVLQPLRISFECGSSSVLVEYEVVIEGHKFAGAISGGSTSIGNEEVGTKIQELNALVVEAMHRGLGWIDSSDPLADEPEHIEENEEEPL